MVIFHSYVSLPEGNQGLLRWQRTHLIGCASLVESTSCIRIIPETLQQP